LNGKKKTRKNLSPRFGGVSNLKTPERESKALPLCRPDQYKDDDDDDDRWATRSNDWILQKRQTALACGSLYAGSHSSAWFRESIAVQFSA
jgi:hypothetical protein